MTTGPAGTQLPLESHEAEGQRNVWREVQVDARIDHPLHLVFAYMADPLRWHEFAPACIYRRQIDRGPAQVGTRWESIDMIGPFPFRFTDTLSELEPDRRVVWLSSAPWNARVEYACEPDGAGTRIRAHYQGDISGTMRLLVGWLPPRVTHWILAQDFRRLGRVLGRQARSAASPRPAERTGMPIAERLPEG